MNILLNIFIIMITFYYNLLFFYHHIQLSSLIVLSTYCLSNLFKQPIQVTYHIYTSNLYSKIYIAVTIY